jgi:protein-disulfide isomerase-like protein with CxxC motif
VPNTKSPDTVQTATKKIIAAAKKALLYAANIQGVKDSQAILLAQRKTYEEGEQKQRDTISRLYSEAGLEGPIVTDSVTVSVAPLPDTYTCPTSLMDLDPTFVTVETKKVYSLNVEAIEAYKKKKGRTPPGIVAEEGRYKVVIRDKKKNEPKG